MTSTMSARSFVRLASPNVMKSPSTPRSILKRPAPLPLSPTSANFSVYLAPSATSPHVHFPNSAKITSTFTTFSPTTYDRAAIVVSHNPVALPAYGDRVFSPSSGTFKSSQAAEEAVSTPTTELSELKLELPTPEITKPAKAAASRASVRFQQNVASKKSTPLPRDGFDSSSSLKFPRSPYPTATPAGKENVTPRRPTPLNVESNTKEVSTPSSTPRFMFGTRDGALWSPGLPRAGPVEPLALSSILSPGARTAFLNPDSILSPIPNAPMPSIATVLAGKTELLSYPPRAVVEM